MDRDRLQQPATGPYQRPSLWPWILIFGLIWIAWSLEKTDGSAPIPYDRYVELVEADQIESVRFEGQKVRGTLKENVDPLTVQVWGRETKTRTFSTHLAPPESNESVSRLLANDVEIVAAPSEGGLAPLLWAILPWFLIGMLIVFFLRAFSRQQDGIFSLLKSQAKTYHVSTHEKVSMDDVAGVYEAKEELREIIGFLKEPDRFRGLGVHPPKGLLLSGPPGTGKTLLAKAVAGEAGVPFFSISGSDFMQVFVGVGASRVRDMFRHAKEQAPCIIFIDELDSIGRMRGAGVGGGNDEREQTLNQLLSELDGFEPNKNVIVLAATNRPDVLDPALLRPGRFDRKVVISLPSFQARLEILKVHARRLPLASDVDLGVVARRMPGASGADLEQVLNDAAMLAGRAGRDKVTARDVDEAQDRVLLGMRRRGIEISGKENAILAYHEAGHAVLSVILPHSDPVQKVSILPRGHSMGVTHQMPERDMYVYPREYMVDRLTVLMGGRAAELLQFDTSTTGAASDFKEANRLARAMVYEWGFGTRFGPMIHERQENVFLGKELSSGRELSEETAREADLDIRELLELAQQRATEQLTIHRASLNALAEALLRKEELMGDEVEKIVKTAVRLLQASG